MLEAQEAEAEAEAPVALEEPEELEDFPAAEEEEEAPLQMEVHPEPGAPVAVAWRLSLLIYNLERNTYENFVQRL